MTILYALLIAALLIIARVLHGADKATKWLLFTPALLAASGFGFMVAGIWGLIGFVPVLASILLIFSGANADNTLSYMYRVDKSSRGNIVTGYSWRVALFVIALFIGCYFTSWFYALLALPMIGSLVLVSWTASQNRHVTGEPERDRNHRENVEWSEGVLAAACACSVWVVLIMALQT